MSARTDMYQTVGGLLDGSITGADAIALLQTQDIRALTAAELAGGVDAVMERAVPFPAYPDAVDCCGTGGDGRATYNISTAAAIVVAARGVPVVKHGNRAVTSRSGSADVLEALGVNTKMSPAHAAQVMEKTGLVFLFAPSFHPGFSKVAPWRKAVNQRTIFNLLGPLCNPARVQRQLIGVYAPSLCALMTETCQLLGRQHVMAVHGEDGTDEFSITGNSHVAELQGKEIRYSAIRPQDAGLAPREGRALVGGDAQQNATALRDVLEGIEGAYADAVALNAAALLVVAGKAPTLHEGVVLARSVIARGDARKKLEQLIEASHGDD